MMLNINDLDEKKESIKMIEIINRNFKVLRNKTKVNEFGLSCTLGNVFQNYIEITIYHDELYYSQQIPTSGMSDEYIEKTLKSFGFDVKLKSILVIDTFDKFKDFLIQNNLYYDPTGISNAVVYKRNIVRDSSEVGFFTKEQLEKVYGLDIKINI